MPSTRLTPLLVTFLLVLTATPAFAGLGLQTQTVDRDEEPATSRGGALGREILILDPQRDVQLQPEGPPNPVDPLVDAVDITRVTVFGETGQSIRMHVKVRNLEAAQNYRDELSGGISLYICFQLGGSNLAAQFRFRKDLLPIINLLGIPEKCSPEGVQFRQIYGAGLNYTINPLDSQLEFLVDRKQLSLLREGPPRVGDRLTNVWVVMRDDVHNPSYRATRWDAAPDKGPATDVIGLRLPTANYALQMVPENSGRPYRTCEGSLYLPSFAIEADGSRSVAVRVSNLDLMDRRVQMFVEREGGFSWETRILPNLTLPSAQGGAAGNATLNAIIRTPPGTAHKTCATLHVRALDAEDPERMGEVSINVFAVIAPSPTRQTFYVHTGSRDRVWISPDAKDRDDERLPRYLPGWPDRAFARGISFSIPEATLSIPADAPNLYDLVLNTTAAQGFAHVTLRLRSENLPTRATFTVSVLSDGTTSELLGTAARTVQLSETAEAFDFVVPVEFTRDSVADGDPSRIVSGRDKIRLFVHYAPSDFDENVQGVRLAGQISLLPEGSSVTLPIWAAIKRNVNEPGESGSFITLRSPPEPMVFANPGKPRSFNFTVQNEGAATDIAVVSASVSGATKANWTILVDPPGPFELEPGRSQAFQVTVTPREGLKESDGVLLEVAASSHADPTARGATAIRVVATYAEDLQLDGPAAPAGEPKKKGSLPGPAPLMVLFAALAGAWGLRRRSKT